jgi:hypothetical protein
MIEIATTSGSRAVIGKADLDELRMKMRGSLLRAGQAGYDEARVIFNGMFDRRPALIARCHGAADVLDVVLSADMVAADGGVLTAQADENADLFWALRGGGGYFGVVTSFEFALHPVGPAVAVVFSMYPMAAARDVLKQ